MSLCALRASSNCAPALEQHLVNIFQLLQLTQECRHLALDLSEAFQLYPCIQNVGTLVLKLL